MLCLLAGCSRFGWKCFFIFVHVLVAFPTTASAKKSSKPHIIFILADDMGWNDVGFHGMTDIPTPNIDALAAHGIVLSNHYAATLCTPSRAALLTGRYPSALGIYEEVLLNGEPWGLPLHFKILPEYLNELGYHSHIVGKWHLGHHRRQYTPTYRGFQTHYGFWNGGVDFFTQETRAFSYSTFEKKSMSEEDIYMVGKDMIDNLKPVSNKNKIYLTELLTRRAKRIIRRHDKSKPLFLFLSHHGVHRGNVLTPMRGPSNETKRFLHFKDSTKRNFAGSLTSLDASVGTIFKELAAYDMLENSVVVFVSDNGAPLESFTVNGGSNWPLRGQKGTPWDGAVRTVATVWSPRLKDTDSFRNGLFHVVDWMPTLYKLAGGNVTNLGNIDGLEGVDYLNHNNHSHREEVLVALDLLGKVEAIRNERYKLVKRSSAQTETDMTAGDTRRNEKIINVPWTGSEVHKTLEEFYRKHGTEKLVVKRPNLDIVCKHEHQEKDLKDRVFLFDMIDDPCERNNVASQNPQIVDQLLTRLQFWRRRSVPHVKKYLDFASDPKNFNGRWDMWLDKTETNPVSSFC